MELKTAGSRITAETSDRGNSHGSSVVWGLASRVEWWGIANGIVLFDGQCVGV